MPIRKLSAGEQAYDPATYVGTRGTMFYNEATGEFRISDAVTPGGIPIPLAVASQTVSGTVKLGPGVVLNGDGQIIIDSTGLDFSFGDLQATTPTLADSTTAATISAINDNQEIIIASNGTGGVNIVGAFEVYATDSDIAGALAEEPFFQVLPDGQVRMLVPGLDSLAGAVEIIGTTSGQSIPTAVSGVMLHITGNNDAFAASIYVDGVGGSGSFVGRRYNGLATSPTQVLSGETITRWAAAGYTTAGFPSLGSGSIHMDAIEDFVGTANGTQIKFSTAALGTNNRVQVASIDNQNGVTATKFTGDGSQLTNLPPPTVLSAVSSANAVVANINAATTITNMTLSPPAGTYLTTFSSEYTSSLLGSVTTVAATDLAVLYTDLMALAPTVTNHASVFGAGGAGETLGPGVYTQAAAASITGTLTLNGSATDLFVFRIAGALTTTNNATIVLTGGAVSSNVWWVVQAAISTGTNVVLRASFVANQAAINPGAGADIIGRLLTINGAIGINTATLIAPTGTSVLEQGSLTEFSIFAAIGALTNVNASTIALSIGTNDGTITGFGTATISGETYPAGAPELAVIAYGIYVDGVLVPDSKRTQSQTRLQSGWSMSIQTLATVTTGQTIDVRTTVPIGGFTIGPGMSLILMPVN
jgi:hypothetical protein